MSKTFSVKFPPSLSTPKDTFPELMSSHPKGLRVSTYRHNLVVKTDIPVSKHLHHFTNSVKAHRKNQDFLKEITFTLNDHIWFIKDEVTADSLILTFLFKGANAVVKDEDEHEISDMYLYPFLFNIIIDRDIKRNRRNLMISDDTIMYFRDYLVHPHHEGGGSGFCFGNVTDQLASSLTLDDLSIYLDGFVMFLLQGTYSADSYGSRYEYFCDERAATIELNTSDVDNEYKLLQLGHEKIKNIIKKRKLLRLTSTTLEDANKFSGLLTKSEQVYEKFRRINE